MSHPTPTRRIIKRRKSKRSRQEASATDAPKRAAMARGERMRLAAPQRPKASFEDSWGIGGKGMTEDQKQDIWDYVDSLRKH